MSIGAITPGNFITITPDALSAIPASLGITPSPTMGVISANMQALALYTLSADTMLANRQGLGKTLAFAGPWIHDTGSGYEIRNVGGAFDTVTANKTAALPLDLPHGAAIAGLKIWIAPRSHVTLPDDQVIVSLWRGPIQPGVSLTSIFTGADATALGSYNAARELAFSVSPRIVVNREAYTYWATVTGEGGANSQDVDIYPLRVTLAL